jgi:hypothetical protein
MNDLDPAEWRAITDWLSEADELKLVEQERAEIEHFLLCDFAARLGVLLADLDNIDDGGARP